MSETESFKYNLKDNYEFINSVNVRILFAGIIITVFLFILSKVGIFDISPAYNLALFIYSLVSFIFIFITTKHSKSKSTLIAFLGLAAVEGFITLAATSRTIGIYITFAVAPVIATLYYNRKFTICMDIISYILMIFSLYFKWKNGAALFLNTESDERFIHTYIPIIAGFTLEYVILFLITLMITKRNTIVLSQKIKALEEVKKSNKQIEEKNEQLEDTQLKIIQFVAQCLGSHDLFTGRHVMHTKEFVYIICRKLKELGYYEDELTDKTIDLYSSAAFLHDIGKIHIPEGVLNKAGKFTEEEFNIMKHHPEEGRKLLEFLPKIGDGEFNSIAIEMAYCHHEKWDGTGYPQKISGKQIPLCARIMAAADVLDALISKRLYKEPMSLDEALKIFEESKGKHFEECIAEAVIQCSEKIRIIDEGFKKQESELLNRELEWWNNYHQGK